MIGRSGARLNPDDRSKPTPNKSDNTIQVSDAHASGQSKVLKDHAHCGLCGQVPETGVGVDA
jgi:hypothetical protein